MLSLLLVWVNGLPIIRETAILPSLISISLLFLQLLSSLAHADWRQFTKLWFYLISRGFSFEHKTASNYWETTRIFKFPFVLLATLKFSLSMRICGIIIVRQESIVIYIWSLQEIISPGATIGIIIVIISNILLLFVLSSVHLLQCLRLKRRSCENGGLQQIDLTWKQLHLVIALWFFATHLQENTRQLVKLEKRRIMLNPQFTDFSFSWLHY